uniref:Uncharacterized protein n=1 Tax=Glossina pallidipes TaxID=7398 RepID=A0A1B0A4N8_GLOPL
MPENIKPNLAVSREQASAKKILDMARGATIFNAQNSSLAASLKYAFTNTPSSFFPLTISDFDTPSRSKDINAANHSELFKAQNSDEELKRLLTTTASLQFRQVTLPGGNVQL